MNLKIESEGELAMLQLALEMFPAALDALGYDFEQKGMDAYHELVIKVSSLDFDEQFKEMMEE